jgi:uncharacterized protein YdeI (YjbR/CyaY-like superfamily)
MNVEPQFFETSSEFRSWLRANHAKAQEIYVGIYKNRTRKTSITWPESVAQALCFGWIDGVRRKLDDDRYSVRFTPRRPGSTWSAVNIRLVAQLESSGQMTKPGRAAFHRRTEARSRTYSYEQSIVVDAQLDKPRSRQFQRNKAAWEFFESLPPSYRKKVLWWVMSAKGDDTKDRRFKRLVDSCAAGKRLD